MELSRVTNLLEVLQAQPPVGAARLQAEANWLFEASEAELCELLVGLEECPEVFSLREGESLFAAFLAPLLRRQERAAARAPAPLGDELRAQLATLYCQWGAANTVRHYLLLWLARGRGEAELALLAELLVRDPPASPQAACLPLSALLRPGAYNPAPLFPRLFDALSHIQLAAAVLDVANFVSRQQLVSEHPARSRAGELAELLGAVGHRLGELQDRPARSPAEAQAAYRTVEEGVALAVSLCDALALCGDPVAIGKLRVVMSLAHRRLRTEAAAALARLGEKEGEEVLLALAAEPVARLRVLAYADELGLAGRVPEQFASPAARAEAELCCWLAEPTQFGLPPARCELIDERTQYWPGFDELVDCFLFRFSYGRNGGAFSNIGIAGPLTHAFLADLGNLPHHEIYALFAGWQAEHNEIFELEPEHWNQAERLEVTRLERRLHDAGCGQIRPLLLGSFFGERALVAEVLREGSPCLAVVDPQHELYLPLIGERSLGPIEAWCLWKGRQLLRTFNEPGEA